MFCRSFIVQVGVLLESLGWTLYGLAIVNIYIQDYRLAMLFIERILWWRLWLLFGWWFSLLLFNSIARLKCWLCVSMGRDLRESRFGESWCDDVFTARLSIVLGYILAVLQKKHKTANIFSFVKVILFGWWNVCKGLRDAITKQCHRTRICCPHVASRPLIVSEPRLAGLVTTLTSIHPRQSRQLISNCDFGEGLQFHASALLRRTKLTRL